MLYSRSTPLLNTLKRPIPRLKINIRSPIVGMILREFTARAISRSSHIRHHSRIEAIPSHYLMHVGGRCDTGLDEGIEAVDYDLGTAEAEHSY